MSSCAGWTGATAWRMGGAARTAGTAAAVPLLREVRQDKVLPYHILVKQEAQLMLTNLRDAFGGQPR